MSKFLHVMLFSLLIAIFAGGCASLNAGNRTNETLRASGVHEDCFELLAGQVIDYWFQASKPLAFNIHYHEDHNIFYPVQKDEITDKGTFRAEKKQYYCLMWTNNNPESATLSYEYSVRKETK